MSDDRSQVHAAPKIDARVRSSIPCPSTRVSKHMLHTPPRTVYTFEERYLVVVSARLGLPVGTCTVHRAHALAHEVQQALLFPELELPVLRGLARGALVLLDGGRLLTVRRRAERVSSVRPEVECGTVRHNLGGGAEHDMSAPALAKVASAQARQRHSPYCPRMRWSWAPSGSGLGSRRSR